MKFVSLCVALLCLITRLHAQAPTVPSAPFKIGITTQLYSAVLKEERTLNIYLPENYDADSVGSYPVIYLLDGSADEDFVHIAGLVQFCNFSWLNILPRSIVVGIANTDRKKDLTFPTTIPQDKKDFPTAGHSENFIRFIAGELQPFIRKNFRTTDSTMLIGQSLGGLLATEILLTKPSLFSQYVIVSPSLWWDNESLLSRPAAAAAVSPQIFLAVGNEGKTMVGDAEKLYQLLQQKKYKVQYQYFPDEDHGTILHEAAYRAFRHFGGRDTIEIKH